VVEEYDASQEETQHIFALRKKFLSDKRVTLNSYVYYTISESTLMWQEIKT